MKTLATLTALALTCSPALAGIAGVWNATASTDNGSREYTVTITRDGDKLGGTSVAVNEGTDRTIDRITDGEKNVTIEYDFERDGNQGVIKIVADKKSPHQLDGKWSIEGTDGTVYMSGPWNATKEVKFSLDGEWDALGTSDNGDEYRSVLTVDDTSGKFVSERGEVTLDGVKVDGKKVNLTFALQYEGNAIPTTIEAEATDDDTLKGNWSIKNSEGVVAATGPWTASRKPAFAIAGAWAVTAALPEGDEYSGSLFIYGSGDKLTGTSKSDDSDETRSLNDVKFDGKSLSYYVPMEVGGQNGKITINATADGTNTLKGKWTLTGPDGNEIASDTLTAKRQ